MSNSKPENQLDAKQLGRINHILEELDKATPFEWFLASISYGQAEFYGYNSDYSLFDRISYSIDENLFRSRYLCVKDIASTELSYDELLDGWLEYLNRLRSKGQDQADVAALAIEVIEARRGARFVADDEVVPPHERGYEFL